jgi:hypothetical protein
MQDIRGVSGESILSSAYAMPILDSGLALQTPMVLSMFQVTDETIPTGYEISENMWYAYIAR